MKGYQKYLPLLLIVGLSISAWLVNLSDYLRFESLKTHQHSIDIWVTQNFLLSIVIYAITYIAVVGLSIPGATFMTLTGGFLFGQWLGTLCSVLCATLGATILFLSAKMASTEVLAKKAGSWAQKMQQGFQEHAFFYLLTLRLIPIFPFVAINLVAALLQIDWRTFLAATLLGIIPGSFVYTSMGVALSEVIDQPEFSPNIILEPKILMALIGLGLLSLLPTFYKKYRSKSP